MANACASALLKSGTPWMTVVGEVADAKLNSPDADASEQFYQPVAQLEKDAGALASADRSEWQRRLHRRSFCAASPADGTRAARRRSLYRSRNCRSPRCRPWSRWSAQSEAPRRFNTIIISSFALAAVLLAVLGIYSIIAFSVASRVQEMAIRMALGSQRSHIMRLVLFSGLKLAAIGCVLGLAGAAAASSILRSFLFHVSPFDPAVMIVGAVVVFALALAASAFPAHRATSVDPVLALRAE